MATFIYLCYMIGSILFFVGTLAQAGRAWGWW